MTSNKTTRRALFGSLMSLLLCCSMLVGTTFAWFTDTVTSTGNIIKSGTLDVEMYYGDSLADVVNETYDAAEGAIFNYKYWEPGYTEVKYLKVKNVGDLAFRYNLYIEPDFTGATTDAEKANLVKLAEALDVYCAIVPDNSYAHPTSLADLASLGTLEYRMGLEEGVDTGVILPVSGETTVKIVDNAKKFDDVKYGNWFEDAVAFVSSREIMVGVGDNKFGHGVTTSRAMVSQLLYNLDGKPGHSGMASFDDVDHDDWYADAIHWAADKGIIDSEQDNVNPNEAISREELAVMLWKYAGSKQSTQSLESFHDADQISADAVTALRWAVEVGLMSGKGDGQLDPMGLTNRAEVASVLMMYFEKVMY